MESVQQPFCFSVISLQMSFEAAMIKVENVSKKFKVYPNRKDRLKEWLSFGKKVCHQECWALRGISLNIGRGQIFGLVGLNGAGKSTLLKVITGTLAATSGRVVTKGKIAALLELGMGFHEELNGRENVIINGKLLGLTSEEIHSRLDSIEAFCELGDYFDKPVRTYSSGMYVRLAFALATSVDPDILIIDEALSVGDAYFQQKCVRRMEEFRRHGTTILFVSHDLSMIKLFCDQVALLRQGQVEAVGSARDMLELYNARLADHDSCFQLEKSREGSSPDQAVRFGNGKAQIRSVSLVCGGIGRVTALEAGQDCQVRLQADFFARVENPTIGILIRDRLGYDIFGTNSRRLYKQSGVWQRGESGIFCFDFQMNLGPGEYTLSVAVHQDETHAGECYQWVDRIVSFKVLPRTDFQFLGVSLLRTKFSVEKAAALQAGSGLHPN